MANLLISGDLSNVVPLSNPTKFPCIYGLSEYNFSFPSRLESKLPTQFSPILFPNCIQFSFAFLSPLITKKLSQCLKISEFSLEIIPPASTITIGDVCLSIVWQVSSINSFVNSPFFLTSLISAWLALLDHTPSPSGHALTIVYPSEGNFFIKLAISTLFPECEGPQNTIFTIFSFYFACMVYCLSLFSIY